MEILKKKVVIVGGIIFLLIVLPITLLFTRQQTRQKSSASASTVLSLVTTQTAITAGQNFTVDVWMNPGNNLVTVVDMDIRYDPAKMEYVSATPNQAVFPQTLRGPIAQNGDLLLSVTIGSDVSKAVSTTVRVATLTFKALATAKASPITFLRDLDPLKPTRVFSVADQDSPAENVLQTVVPLTVDIAAGTTPTVTLPPTSIPTIKISPTVVPTSIPTIIPTPTKTTTPTAVITNTPTTVVTQPVIPTAIPTQIPGTTLSASVKITDVTNNGKNRKGFVYIYNLQNQFITKLPLNTTSTNGIFKGIVSTPSLATGDYIIKVKLVNTLARQVAGVVRVTRDIQTILPQITVATGDVDDNNVLNLLDYNDISSCAANHPPAGVDCKNADLNDDGHVEEIDANILLRAFINRDGDPIDTGYSPTPTYAPTPTPTATTVIPAVNIRNSGFNPTSLTVKKGTTVTWTNNDAIIHVVTSNTGAFAPQKLNPGDTFQFTFNTPGDYPYYCSTHPTMTGVIHVTQ